MPDEDTDIHAIRAGVCRLIPEWEPGELFEFAYLPAGYSNHNFRFARRGQRYVVRAPLEPPAADSLLAERTVYDSLESLPLPDVVAMSGDGWLVSRWVEGPLLVDAPPAPEDLVDFIQRVHESLHVDAAPYDPAARSLRYLATPGEAAPDAKAVRIARNLEWESGHTAACHNDLNPWNVIVSASGDWVTLDWQSVGGNDPLFDLTTLHQGLGLAGEGLAALCEALLEEPVAASRVERLLTGFWLREYAWAFAALQLGNRRQEILDQLAVSLDQLNSLTS